ncbi:hypothetical protein ACN28I_37910 [Archangium gephyra]|uniref:hypothetical protein n=1 Tax=Archangium gephyra TaxID=48 RepID=UPI003B7B3965
MRSHGLRIAFFGASLVSAWWNGAAMYYRGLLKALHARGHQITFYEPALPERQRHRDLPVAPDWATVVVYSVEGTRGLERCLEEARDADVVVKASNVGFCDEWLDARVLELEVRPDPGRLLGSGRSRHPGAPGGPSGGSLPGARAAL